MLEVIIDNIENIDYAKVVEKISKIRVDLLKRSYEVEDVIDLTDRSITLLCASSVYILNSVKSYLNCMRFMKFTETIFFTDKYHPEFDLLPKSVKIVQGITLQNIFDYSRFIVCDLYKYLDTKYFLIIQHDGTIVRPWVWTDDFLKYDYIGAPYPKRILAKRCGDPFLVCKYPDNAVGNGGFCLRSYNLAKTVAEKDNVLSILKRLGGLEDVLYCGDREVIRYCTDRGIRIAPIELASKFSIELDYTYLEDEWFGVHNRSAISISKYYINNLDLNYLTERCKRIYG